MKLNTLWGEFWNLTDDWEDESIMKWINKLLKKEPDNIDFRHIYLEIMVGKGLDAEWEKEEPVFMNFCSSIIREREKHKPITIAKAYCYRGEIRNYALDRRKDFDKALVILNSLPQNDSEVKYLKKFIELEYPLHVRQYLFIERNYMDMFKF